MLNTESKSKNEKDLVIKIDSSVRETIINELNERNIILEVKSIEPFQFIVSEDIGGFIKTFQEFYESIKTRDFFNNAKLLRNQFLRPLFILEDDDSKDLDRKILLETLATLFIHFDIPVIFSRNAKDTVKLLLTITRREKSDKVKRIATRMTKAPTEISELQNYILKGIPSINDELARKLLVQFKTFENLVTAKPEDFMEVKGIGKKLAEKLYTVFNSLYRSDQ
ncbi:MAG: ERCC4 domain-containing protein [Promethearchaeota archaeon]